MRARAASFVFLAAVAVGAIVGLNLVWEFVLAVGDEWSDLRLAPTFGLVNGVPLWFSYGEGPVLDAIYGPVGPLTWLPATAGRTPASAIAIATVLGAALLFVPVVWILRMEARRDATLLVAVLLLGQALRLSTPALPGLGVHTDIPALGYATFALACVWTARRRRSAVWRWMGAFFVIASVGSKQVMVPLLAAWPAWIAIASGWPAGRRALVALLATGVASLAAVIAAFDVGSMIDAAILGPLRHPWIGSTLAALWIVAVELVQRCAPIAALLGLAAFVVSRRHATWQRAVRGERWLFPLAVGLALVPTSLAGGAKVGGAANSLSFTIWFVWLALLAAAATAARRGRRLRQQVTVGAAIAGLVLAARLAPNVTVLPELLREPPPSSVAFAAATAAPGTIYFPYRPLVGMLVDGRVDHVDPGLLFREYEGRHLDEAFVRAWLPPALEKVAADRQLTPHSLNYLPKFRRQIVDPLMPGWIVLTESDLIQSGERPADPLNDGEILPALPTRIAEAQDSPVRLVAAELTVPDRSRRPVVHLEAITEEMVPHSSVELEVLLRDHTGRLVVTLAATAEGTSVSEDWPMYVDMLRAVSDAVVLVRQGQPVSGAKWRVPAADVRAMSAAAPLAR